MISAIGGTCTQNVSEDGHILVVKQPADQSKIERAKQLGQQVVNYYWLMQVYLGNMRAWVCNIRVA